jgi:hypothetical protein
MSDRGTDKIKIIFCGGIAYLCMCAAAFAWDADPKSFRADPQAWVRNVLMPGCKSPADAATAGHCACMVPLIAQQATEADVAHVNDPDFKQRPLMKLAVGAGLLCSRK